MEHFDEEVRSRLKLSQEKTIQFLSERERWLLELTKFELDDRARFDSERPRFYYVGRDSRAGWYNLDWKQAEVADEHFFRQDHPLAQELISRAISRELPITEVALDHTGHHSKISVIEPLVGQSGWMDVSKLTVTAVETDEFLILTGRTDHHRVLDDDVCRKLLSLSGIVGQEAPSVPDLQRQRDSEVALRLQQIDERNGRLFDEEVLKLDRWSEDLKLSLEQEIKELDREIRDLRRTAALVQSLEEKLGYQKQIRDLERRRTSKRRELFDAQDEIDQHREELISRIEKQLKHSSEVRWLFTIRWRVR